MRFVLQWVGMVLILALTACGGGGGTVQDTSGNPGSTPDLPPDTGGSHTAYLTGTTTSPYGHYVYLPGGYTPGGSGYPLLVFLHGAGEKGSGATLTDLNRVLVHGPPKLIASGDWNPPVPMIVASPQTASGWGAATIDDFIDYLRSTYTIDETRIYLTGLSMGGIGTFSYLTQMGSMGQVAAAVPICGQGNTGAAAAMKHVPVWAFHGDADKTVSVNGSINMVNAINAQSPPVPARLTLYPGVGHNSWARTYDGSGMGTERADYDPFDQSIYAWMLHYQLLP